MLSNMRLEKVFVIYKFIYDMFIYDSHLFIYVYMFIYDSHL